MACQMYPHVIRVIVLVLAVSSSAASAGAVSQEAAVALAKVVPEGYRSAAVIPCRIDGAGKNRFVAALVDTDGSDPSKVVRLLFLAWNGRWAVLDSIDIAANEASAGPQYLNGIAVVKVGTANLLYVYTNWFGGGSGSIHYFQFFRIAADHLQLVRGFKHDRMERGLLCLRNDRIYDAAIACSRGDKKGGSYQYSCYLDTSELSYDGQSIIAVRNERLEERTGNRYLGETYWNTSLRSVLQRGGHFQPLL